MTWNHGGSGNWDTTASNTVWLNSGSASVAYADGSSVTFGNVSGGTSTITVASGGVAPAGVAINNTIPGTGYAFVGGAISGTGALYLQPTNVGSVSLSGTNTYTGGTQVSGGTLIVAGDSSLGASSGAGGAVVLDNGSTLQLASPFVVGPACLRSAAMAACWIRRVSRSRPAGVSSAAAHSPNSAPAPSR